MIYLDINDNIFSNRIFQIFNKDSKIKFFDFVCVTYNYCTLSDLSELGKTLNFIVDNNN